MTNLTDIIVERRVLSIVEDSDGELHVHLREGISDFIVDHPGLTTMAAGYLIHKIASTPPKTVDVVTNTFKFFARTPAERKLQKELVDELIATSHYTLQKTYTENGVMVWVVRRRSR